MVEIGEAFQSEAEEIAQFMNVVFDRAKWGLEGWRALLDGRWSAPDDVIAITVRDAGKLVGVLGLLTANRPTAQGMKRITSMSSWYIQKPYRGGGIGRELMARAAAGPGLTVTNFTSAVKAIPVVFRAGLTVLDDTRLLWKPGAPPRGFRLHSDPLALGADLPDRDRRIIADHQGLPLRCITVETPDGLCTLILAVQKKSDPFVMHEMMYASDLDLLARHSAGIARAALPETDAMLSVDSRFIPGNTDADERRTIPVPRYYTPGRISPDMVDFLYSEVVLLNQKLA